MFISKTLHPQPHVSQHAEQRYLPPGKTRRDLYTVLADKFGKDEKQKNEFLNLLISEVFVPSTPVLGSAYKGLLPISCYLSSIGDSLQSITGYLSSNIRFMSEGGGVAMDFSNLRSYAAGIATKDQTKSSGVIPFTNLYDAGIRATMQGGVRRGAGAFYLDISHPEIVSFLKLRDKGGSSYLRAHQSHTCIKIPDAFMRKVKWGEDWDLIDPHTKEVAETISARTLWEAILKTRLQRGEPYLYFTDNVIRSEPQELQDRGLVPKHSNLCTEITMVTGEHDGLEYSGVCCLGSINLAKIKDLTVPSHVVKQAITFLDRVLTVYEEEIYKFSGEVQELFIPALNSVRHDRSIALGVMGFQTFLQLRDIPFSESVIVNRNLFQDLYKDAIEASKELGEELGVPKFMQHLPPEQRRRNTHVLGIAPTSSISFFSGGVSPTIEPIRANIYSHRTGLGDLTIRNPALTVPERTWEKLEKNGGSFVGIDDSLAELYPTASEVNQHHLVQLAADRAPYIDQAQSTNLFATSKTTLGEAHELTFNAWKKGCKTLYYHYNESNSETTSVGASQQKQEEVKEAPSCNDYEECSVCQ